MISYLHPLILCLFVLGLWPTSYFAQPPMKMSIDDRNKSRFHTEAQADSTKRNRLEHFYFQSSGTPKRLLSADAYAMILSAAKVSGYEEDEIEVIIYAVDKVSREERRAPLPNFRTTPNRGDAPKSQKGLPKKFE